MIFINVFLVTITRIFFIKKKKIENNKSIIKSILVLFKVHVHF